jgi:hypothetical protein
MKVIEWWKSLTEETRKEYIKEWWTSLTETIRENYMKDYLEDSLTIDTIHSIFGMKAEYIAEIYVIKTGNKL